MAGKNLSVGVFLVGADESSTKKAGNIQGSPHTCGLLVLSVNAIHKSSKQAIH